MAAEENLDPVLVVIPCLNEERHLPGLLDSLSALPAGWLVVVADGGSQDGSRAIVEDAQQKGWAVKLLDNPRRIQSAGVNLAVRTFGADFRWLVRIDAHCRYPASYVEGLVAVAGRTDAASVVTPMVTEGEGCFQKGCAAAQNSVLGNGGSAHRKLTVGQYVDHGHHALFDLPAFARAGGYDETFSHNEDAELDQRLARDGGRIWLEPSLAITYFPRRSPGPLFRQYYKYGQGRARTVQRHKTPMKVRQIVPLAVAPAVVLAPFGLLWWPLALPAAAWVSLCLAFGALLSWRAKDLCVLWSGLAAMISHLAWSAGFLVQILVGSKPCAEPTAF